MSRKGYDWEKAKKDMLRCVFSDYIESRKNTPAQKTFEGFLFSSTAVFVLVPCLIFPFMFSFEWEEIVQHIIILIWILYPLIVYIFAAIRKKIIMKKLMGIPVGEEKVEIINILTPEELDFIYDTNGNVFQVLGEPDAEFCNIMYNWYYNMNILKDDKLILYMVDAAMFEDKFHALVMDVDVFTKVLGVFCKDMNVKNVDEFARITNRKLNLPIAQREYPSESDRR